MSTMVLYVYLLTPTDIAAVNAFNAIHQIENPPFIASVVDYGAGSCLDTSVLDDPMYIDLRNDLDAIVPIEDRVVTEIVYESPF